MPTRHKLGSLSPFLALIARPLGRSRSVPGGLVHLMCMETNHTLNTVLSLSELVARLRVSVLNVEGATYGVNAWRSNARDRRIYQEG